MSLTQIEEVECSSCGRGFAANVWGAVNAVTDPELKELLLGGELNVARCPKCGVMFYVEKFVLYHDPAAELMAFVYPEHFSSAVKEWHEKMTVQFETVQREFDESERLKYAPMLVFGLDALCGIIRADEDLEDEVRIVEYECRRRKMKTLNLSAFDARAKGIPRVIPVMPGKSGGHSADTRRAGRKSVAEAVEAILRDNPALEYYKRFVAGLPLLPDDIFDAFFFPKQ